LREQCRINPDFTSPFRNDVEFFIPQLCSFYLKGALDDTKDLLTFILQGCQTDFFFAHRIWFFFYSSMFENYKNETYLSTRKVLKGMKRALISTDVE